MTNAYRVWTKCLAHHFRLDELATLATKEGVFCGRFMGDLQKRMNPKSVTEAYLLH